MTTIAFRDGIMAADTGMVSGNISTRANKLRQATIDGERVLAGLSGILPDADEFWRWYILGADRDNLPEFRQYRGADDAPDFQVLVVSELGMTVWREWFQPIPIIEPFFAIGSGSHFAMGAMDMGATAVQAVQIAMNRDSGTFGSVQTLEL